MEERIEENLKDNDKNKPKKGKRNIISVCVILIIYRKINKNKDRERYAYWLRYKEMNLKRGRKIGGLTNR